MDKVLIVIALLVLQFFIWGALFWMGANIVKGVLGL